MRDLINGLAVATIVVVGACAGERVDIYDANAGEPVGDGPSSSAELAFADLPTEGSVDSADAAAADVGSCPGLASLVGSYKGNFDGEVSYGPTLVSGDWSFDVGSDGKLAGQMSGSGGGQPVTARLTATVTACGAIDGTFVEGKVAGFDFSGDLDGTLTDGFFIGEWHGEAMGYGGAGTWKAWKQ